MKQQEITTLKLIESLERDPKQTQRDLARELNISLGLVNAFTKRLIKKGYLKTQSISKNRVKYTLTSKGMSEKAKLTYHYLLYSIEFYKESRAKIRSIYDLLFEQGKRKIFLIGTGELAEIALITLQESNLELGGIIDDEKAGDKFLGIIINDQASLNSIMPSDIIMITKYESNRDLSSMLRTYDMAAHIVDLSKWEDGIWKCNV